MFGTKILKDKLQLEIEIDAYVIEVQKRTEEVWGAFLS